ncbi:hypothetical protein FB451DRAFT_1300069 [Mycena latifolia]|nr:hypothetical protein FB451DRAFT_1300069 [Mycena latifolia]
MSQSFAPFLRTVVLRFAVETIATLSGMSLDLSQVRELTLHTADDAVVEDAAVESAQFLIRTATLEEVWLQVSFTNLSVFSRLFRNCTPNLRKITFAFCEHRPPVEVSALIILEHGPQRAEITHLVLRWSPSIPEWLMSRQCPFDLTHLVDLWLWQSVNANCSSLLNGAAGTLERVRIGIVDLNAGLDFGRLRALTYLTLDICDEGELTKICALVDALSTVGPWNVIQDITINITSSITNGHWTEALESTWQTLDAGPAATPLPALRGVKVLLPEDWTVLGEGEIELSRGSLPKLDAAGLLVFFRTSDGFVRFTTACTVCITLK